MPIEIPTIQTIRNRLLDEAVTRSGDPALRDSHHPANVLLTSLSAPIADLYQQLEASLEDSFVTTATGNALDRLARVWSLLRTPASSASGVITIKGAPETRVPENTLFGLPTGAHYRTINAGEIGETGQLDMDVEAVDGGRAGNAAQGVELTLVNPVAGLASSAIAKTAFGGGGEGESDSAFRARILARIRTPARAGTANDYRHWALDSQGHGKAVTRAWVYPKVRGVGTIDILIMMDDSYDDGIPQTADLSAVKDYINLVRPLGADIVVKAPRKQVVDIAIASLVPDEQPVKDAIRENLAVLFRRLSKPGGTIALSQISEAISSATNEISHVLTTPTGNVTSSGRILPVLGEVTFT